MAIERELELSMALAIVDYPLIVASNGTIAIVPRLTSPIGQSSLCSVENRIRSISRAAAALFILAGMIALAGVIAGELELVPRRDRAPISVDTAHDHAYGFDDRHLHPRNVDVGPAREPYGPARSSPSVDAAMHLNPPSASVSPAPTSSATADALRVGIIPGHWRYDSGAVCPDGLQEVHVTTDVALRVQAILATRGIAVDLLAEQDPDRPGPPLLGYSGKALVSLHADSCEPIGASGFRVARWRGSPNAAASDRLVDCLYAEYGAATMLPRHDASITIDMWNYYAFRAINIETPAAIIELAFLSKDRAFVNEHRYSMALGVANGISCFLRDG